MLALSAFGGPFAHLALMQERLVERRQYLSNEELLELNALCQFLPGPTSTQTITAVGLKLGGQRLALLTLLLWVLPACLLMTFLAVLVYSLEIKNLDMATFRWLPPVAVGFVAASAWRLLERQPWKGPSLPILGLSIALSLSMTSDFTFPAVLLLGGLLFWGWEERRQRIPVKGSFVIREFLSLWEPGFWGRPNLASHDVRTFCGEQAVLDHRSISHWLRSGPRRSWPGLFLGGLYGRFGFAIQRCSLCFVRRFDWHRGHFYARGLADLFCVPRLGRCQAHAPDTGRPPRSSSGCHWAHPCGGYFADETPWL